MQIGHVHAYERAYPTYANKKMANNYVNPSATTHVVAGAAGVHFALSLLCPVVHFFLPIF